MKRTIIALFIFSLLTGMVHAQSKTEQEVASAVESLRKAMVDPDKASLDKIVHPDLSYGHSSGKIDTKDTFIESLIRGESNFTSITLSDQTIQITGNLALVRHKLSGNTHDQGKDPGTVNLGILLVWYKTKNNWQLLGRQAFKL